MKEQYLKTTLKNGLRLISYHMPEKKSVSLGIWVKVGGRFEDKANNGIAHFLEHLLFKGSKKYSCRQIKESIEGIGGSLNGFTGEEFCCYLAKLPEKYSILALNILSDMILNPRLPEEEVIREKGVVFEEIKMYRDLPQSYSHQLLDALLWPADPLGRCILGTLDSIQKINRNDLLRFQKKYYTLPNIVVAACGNLKHERLVKQTEKIFRLAQKTQRNQFNRVSIHQGKPQLEIFAKETDQMHFALGFHGLARDDPRRYALGVLHIILGGNMSSRLFHEVREKKGLAYQISTEVKYLSDTGAFIVNAGIDKQNVLPALNLILKELEKIKDNLVSAAELKRAKEFYIGQTSISLEDTLDHMLWIGETTVALDKTYSLNEVIAKIKEIERDDLRQLAREVFKESKRNLAIVGPIADYKTQIYDSLQKG